MAKKNRNLGNPNLPTYTTLKEIIVKGTEMGGDKKQFAFIDKNKVEQSRSFNQTMREMCGIGTYFKNLGLVNQSKIAIVAENSYDWMIAYYAILMTCNISVPMDCKLPVDDLADQLIRCDCDVLVYTGKFDEMVEDFKKNVNPELTEDPTQPAEQSEPTVEPVVEPTVVEAPVRRTRRVRN